VTWDKTVKQIVHEAHMKGALDVLRAVLDCFDMEPDHSCMARTWAEQMYRDPTSFDEFVRQARETR
jgi:hypothetical protein